MYPNLSLYLLKVIGNFDKQCFVINFYDFFSGDAKNENIIESLGIAKIKTESIDREIGDFVESIQAKMNLMNKLGGDK